MINDSVKDEDKNAVNQHIVDEDINLIDMDLNELSININAEPIIDNRSKKQTTNSQSLLKKELSKPKIRMLSDVDVDLLELFSEGQYNLGNMN